MKAIVVTGPERVELVERPGPRPAPDEVVLRVACAGICHTDHFIVSGYHPAVEYPVVPGHEFSGAVIARGDRVKDLTQGDLVAVVTQLGCGRCVACAQDMVGRCRSKRELGSSLDGGWQEEIAVPARAVRKLPRELGLTAGALTEPSANAHALVRRARINPQDTVAIIGPGAIGLLALQYALLCRPSLVVVAGLEHDEPRLERARRLGAHATVAASPERLAESILLHTHGHGADVVLQCAPSVVASAVAVEVAAANGRILVEGFAASSECIELAPDSLVLRELSLEGVCGWSLSDFDAALDLNGRGAISVESLITHCFSFDDFDQALQTAADWAAGAIKVVFANSAPCSDEFEEPMLKGLLQREMESACSRFGSRSEEQ